MDINNVKEIEKALNNIFGNREEMTINKFIEEGTKRINELSSKAFVNITENDVANISVFIKNLMISNNNELTQEQITKLRNINKGVFNFVNNIFSTIEHNFKSKLEDIDEYEKYSREELINELKKYKHENK